MSNALNAAAIDNRNSAIELLDELKDRPPFMCQFEGDNGYGLTVGIACDHGCVQYAANDGSLPYLMAVQSADSNFTHGEMEFSVGGTPTPIDGRYRLTLDTLKEIVVEFVESGGRSDHVEWEEI